MYNVGNENFNIDLATLQTLNSDMYAINQSIKNEFNYLNSLLLRISDNVQGDQLNPLIEVIKTKATEVSGNIDTVLTKLQEDLDVKIAEYSNNEEVAYGELTAVLDKMAALVGLDTTTMSFVTSTSATSNQTAANNEENPASVNESSIQTSSNDADNNATNIDAGAQENSAYANADVFKPNGSAGDFHRLDNEAANVVFNTTNSATNDRFVARQTNVTGEGSEIYRRGEGLGTGPVGPEII